MKYIKNLIVIMVVGLLIGSVSFGEVVQPKEEVKEEVFTSEWAENCVKGVQYNEVFDDFFHADYQKNITHEEACYMMIKILEKVNLDIENKSINEENEYVEKARKLGILENIDFDADKPITKEEYAHMLCKTIELMPDNSGFSYEIGSSMFEQDIMKPNYNYKYKDDADIDRRYIASIDKLRLYDRAMDGTLTVINDENGKLVDMYRTYYPKSLMTKEAAMMTLISSSAKAMKGIIKKPIAYYLGAHNQFQHNKELFEIFGESIGTVTDGQGEDWKDYNLTLCGTTIQYSSVKRQDEYDFWVSYLSNWKYASSDGYYRIEILMKRYNPTIKDALRKILIETLDEERGSAFFEHIDRNIMSTKKEDGSGYDDYKLDDLREEIIKDRCKIIYTSGSNYLGIDLLYKKDFK